LLILAATAARFFLRDEHREHLQSADLLWAAGAMALAAVFSAPLVFSARWRREEILQLGLVGIDIFVVTYFYRATGTPHSDYFLCYALPIVWAVEYLDGLKATVVFVFTSAVFAWAVMNPGWGTAHWVVYFERELLLSFVFTSSLFLIQLTVMQEDVLFSLKKINDFTTAATKADSKISDLLDKIIGLGFEFVALSVVDPYRQKIRMTKARNVPSSWMRRSQRDLNGTDIMADVLRNGRSETPKFRDRRFDRHTWRFFRHWKLARAFVPVLLDGEKLAVLQAGWDAGKGEVPQSLVEQIERLGEEWKGAIAEARPFVLLEKIAQLTIDRVGADSASLHVFEGAKVILEAGAPARQDIRDLAVRFPPSESGLGRKVMANERALWIDDPKKLKSGYPHLYERGIAAFAAVPIHLEGNYSGVLYLHFRKQRKITRNVTDLAEVFAAQMAFAIQNHLLIRTWADEANRVRMQARLELVEQAASANAKLQEILKRAALTLLYNFDADNVTLYEYVQAANRFHTPPVMVGEYRNRRAMRETLPPGTFLEEFAKKGHHFITDVSREPMLTGPRDDGKSLPRFVEREGIASSAVICLKAGPETVGLIFVNYRQPTDFTIEDRASMLALASSAAAAIHSARVRSAAERLLEHRRDALIAIHDIDEMLASRTGANMLDTVLERILGEAVKLTQASAAWVMWYDAEVHHLRWRVSHGVEKHQSRRSQPLDYGIVGLCARTKKPQRVGNVNDGEWREVYKCAREDTISELAVPILDGEKLIGVINLEHSVPNAFSEEDQIIAEILAVQAVSAARTLDLFEHIEEQRKPLLALGSVAARIQISGHELDTILRIILTGITAGEGLGFSRALLYLAAPQGTQLRGRVAVGAFTGEEARNTWECLQDQLAGKSRDERFAWLLDDAKRISIAIRENKRQDCALSLEVQRTSISGGQFVGGPALVTAQDHWLRDQLAPLGFKENAAPFVFVPLRSGEKLLGLIIVDLRFQRQREISAGDLAILERFGELAAIAVESRTFRTGTTPEERAENWQNVLAAVIHLVGGRLSVLDGQVELLREDLIGLVPPPPAAPDPAPALLAHIAKLKAKILAASELVQTLRRSAPGSRRFLQYDPVPLITQLVNEAQPTVKGELTLDVAATADPSAPVLLAGDPERLYDAVFLLIQNAEEAMAKMPPGHAPRIRVALTRSARPPAGEDLVCIVEDNGPGVPEQFHERIFEPGFTTKTGTSRGLGLAIVRDIVESYSGSISLDPGIEKGARIVIRVPIIEGGSEKGRAATA
jgi:GAF domain-containing protein